MFDMFEAFKEDKEKPDSGSHDVSSPVSGNLFVVSVGGSVLVREKPNTAFIGKFSNSINSLLREGHKFVLVVGGGKIARDYVAAAKALGAGNYLVDEIAIKITHANACLLLNAIEDAYPKVLSEISQAKEIIDSGKIPVFGGLIPGFTTDTVAALLSEFLGATFINLTNQDGVYNMDPAKFKQAQLIEEMDHERLLRIMLKSDSRNPGENVIIDSFTCMILARSNIPSLIMSAEDLPNFESAVRGSGFKGTIVSPRTDNQSNGSFE